MNKYILILAILFITHLLQAQTPATIECRIGEGIGNKIHIFRVENGRKISIADAIYHKNNYYGFKFIPNYEGFYVIGDDQRYQYPIYLKAGDAISIYMDKDTVRLEGKKNTPENVILFKWRDLSKKIETKALHFYRIRSTYEDFFPEFEDFIPAANHFKTSIKTKNTRFNELMLRSIDFEKDYYALSFLYTPRTKHPTKEQRIDYYNHIIQPNKFMDDVILQMPYGMDLISRYTTFATLEAQLPGIIENILPSIGNDRVKGEIVVNRASGIKSHFEYTKYAKQYEKLLDSNQKQRLEAIGSNLYQTQQGQPAANFTYPDSSGKQISLSDFKGKVVLVDVWATWCGPCRGELPHLKKLEEELKGTDVVFMGVSLDEDKNLEKWKKFIVDEQLPGIQLFAGGWSKIAKDYKITGIPRFMVFSRDGKIVEVQAPRPSSPNLKLLLESELKK